MTLPPISTDLPLVAGAKVAVTNDVTYREKRIPAGAVGIITTVFDDHIEAFFVGAGIVPLKPHEVTPIRAMDAAQAARKNAEWDALQPCRILATQIGSKSWGLGEEDLTEETRGVFALPYRWQTGLAEAPTEITSVDGGATFWEVGRMIRQALRGDPSTLELLFVPTTRATDPMGQWILHARDAFVSQAIYDSFGKFALQQLKRLANVMHLSEHREVVFQWLREDPIPSLDEMAERLAKLEGEKVTDAVYRTRDYIKHLYRTLHDQGLLAARDYDALARFARTNDVEVSAARELRPKNAYKLVRLIAVATNWLRTGRPEFVVQGELRDQIIAIKSGLVPLPVVVQLAEGLTQELDKALRSSTLPARPHVARADALLRRIREETARRHFAEASGPFGADAPQPPEPAWEDEG